MVSPKLNKMMEVSSMESTTAGCKKAVESSNTFYLTPHDTESNSAAKSESLSRIPVAREYDPSNMESCINFISAPSIEETTPKSTSLDRGPELDEELRSNEKRELATATTPGGRLSTSTVNPKKMQLIEALSVPLHLEKSVRIMKMMGYQGGPLGVRGDGITEPIMPALDLVNGAGLGYSNGGLMSSDTTQPKIRRIESYSPVYPSYSPRVSGYANIKRMPTVKGCHFRTNLLTSAIRLISTDVTTVQLSYNQKHKKKRKFVKYFFETVNDGCNFDLGIKGEAHLGEMLRMEMKNSPWKIEGSETIDRQLILKKVPASNNLKPEETNLAPRHLVCTQDDPETRQNCIEYNDMPIVYITDQRLNYYVNNVSFPNLKGYLQTCTFSLAFRLILLDEILYFSKSNKAAIAIDLGVMIDNNESEFIFKLTGQATRNPKFETKMEYDTYRDISFVMFNQNLLLDIAYASERTLIVRKLPDTPACRRMSRERLGERYWKNNVSNPDAHFNSNDDVQNLGEIIPVWDKEVDKSENITVVNKEIEYISFEDKAKVNEELKEKEYNKSYYCFKPIVDHIKEINENHKETKLLINEDNDVVIVDRVNEIIPATNDEAGILENTVKPKIKSIAFVKETKENEKFKINQKVETLDNTVITDDMDAMVKKNNESLFHLEQCINDIRDGTKRKSDSSVIPITQKRFRRQSEPTDISKMPQLNIGFKPVTIVPKIDQKEYMSKESILK